MNIDPTLMGFSLQAAIEKEKKRERERETESHYKSYKEHRPFRTEAKLCDANPPQAASVFVQPV